MVNISPPHFLPTHKNNRDLRKWHHQDIWQRLQHAQTVYLAPKEIHLEPVPYGRLGGWMEWLEEVVNREKRGSLARHGLDNDRKRVWETERGCGRQKKGEMEGSKDWRLQSAKDFHMKGDKHTRQTTLKKPNTGWSSGLGVYVAGLQPLNTTDP